MRGGFGAALDPNACGVNGESQKAGGRFKPFLLGLVGIFVHSPLHPDLWPNPPSPFAISEGLTIALGFLGASVGRGGVSKWSLNHRRTSYTSESSLRTPKPTQSFPFAGIGACLCNYNAAAYPLPHQAPNKNQCGLWRHDHCRLRATPIEHILVPYMACRKDCSPHWHRLRGPGGGGGGCGPALRIISPQTPPLVRARGRGSE